MSWIEERITSTGKKYRYIYAYVNGKKKLIHRAGTKKQDAIDIRNSVSSSLVRRQAGIADDSKTINAVSDEYIVQSKFTKKPATIHCINAALLHLKKELGYRTLISVSRYDIERLKNFLLKDHKINGVNIIMRSICAMFNFAVKTGYLKENPAKGMQMKSEKVARFLSDEEVKQLSNSIPYNPELKLLIKIALLSGMRLGEILSIRKENIRNGMIHITNTKTGDDRIVPIHKELKDILANPEFIKDWSKYRVEGAFRKAVKRSKLGRIRFHDLRHTFCSNYLKNGGTTADLRKISGHKTLTALQIYAHFEPAYLKEKIDRISVGTFLG